MRLTVIGRVARNSIAMTGALLIKRVSNLMLYILIARYLGVLVFGQFSLVYTFFIIFQVPAMFGLTTLIVREVAKSKSDFDRYLVNGHIVVMMASLASLGIWALVVHLMGYSSQVIKASYLLGLALIPFAMSKVCEAIFQAFERMQFITYAFGLTGVARIGLVWLLLGRGFGLLEIIGLLAIIQLALLVMEWYFIYHYFPRPSWAIDWSFCRKLFKVAPTFLGITIFATILLRLNIVVLSKLQGEVEVGLYNAAFQLTFVFMLITLSLKQSVYPVLSRIYEANLARFKRYVERSIEFLISLALPIALCFFFLAEPILLVYRAEFVAAAPVLVILGWMLVPLSFTRIFGSLLVASGWQRTVLIINVVNTVCLGALSLILIHNFGLIGAGVAALASHIIFVIIYYAVISKKIFVISIPRVTWRPIVSSLILAGFFALTREGHGLLFIIPSAVILYMAALISLNFLFGGPLRSLRVWSPEGMSRPDIQGTEI